MNVPIFNMRKQVCLLIAGLAFFTFPANAQLQFSVTNLSSHYTITCSQPSVVLVASSSHSAPVSYFWMSSSFTANTSSVTLLNGGSYTVIASAGQSTASTVFGISVNTVAPVTSIGPTFQNVTCALAAIPVTVTAVNPSLNIVHHVFSTNGGTFVSAGQKLLYTGGVPGSYSVVTTNLINGCSVAKGFTTTSSDGFPTLNLISSPAGFTLGCNSQSCTAITFTNGQTDPIGGAVSYSLLTPASSTQIANGILSPILSHTLCAPGNYTAVVRDNSTGCVSRFPFSVLSNTFGPELNLHLSSQSVCHGSSVSITASGAGSYSFSGGVQNGVPFIPSTSGSYTVTATEPSSGCMSTTVIPIFVHPVPTLALNAASVCVGVGTVVLTASGASSYTWSGGITNGIPFTPIANTVYIVYGSSTAGCVSSATVSSHPAATISATASKSVICKGDQVTLIASGADIYIWNHGVINGAPFSPTATASYSVVGSNTPAGCSGTFASLSITVNPVPAFDYTVVGLDLMLRSRESCDKFYWDFGNNTTNTINPSPALTYSAPGIYGVCLRCEHETGGCTECLNIQLPANGMDGVGLAEQLAVPDGVSLFPNPSESKIFIEAIAPCEVHVFNALGETVIRYHYTKDRTEIDISTLSKGIYTVRFVSGSFTTCRRVVKN